MTSIPHMDEQRRLELIVEAVRYCQRVASMGMKPSSYSKALREPVYFLWECRQGTSKDQRAQYRSRAALGVQRGAGQLVCDHAVPFNYLQDELLGISEVTARAVRDVLNRHGVTVLITKEEDRRLNQAGLRSRMPDDWDGSDRLARYKAAGIKILRNLDRLATLLEPLFKVLRDPEQADQLPDVGANSELLENDLLLSFLDAVPMWWPVKRPEWEGVKPRAWSPTVRRNVLAHQIADYARWQLHAKPPLTARQLLNTLRHIEQGVRLEEPTILEQS